MTARRITLTCICSKTAGCAYSMGNPYPFPFFISVAVQASYPYPYSGIMASSPNSNANTNPNHNSQRKKSPTNSTKRTKSLWHPCAKSALPVIQQHYNTDMTVLDTVSSYKSSAVAEMGDRGHNRHGPKRGGWLLCPFCRGAGSPSNTMWPGPRSTSVPHGVFIHPDVCPQPKETWTENCGAVSLLGGDATPSNTMSPGPRFTSIPSGILIHPAVWPQ